VLLIQSVALCDLPGFDKCRNLSMLFINIALYRKDSANGCKKSLLALQSWALMLNLCVLTEQSFAVGLLVMSRCKISVCLDLTLATCTLGLADLCNGKT